MARHVPHGGRRNSIHYGRGAGARQRDGLVRRRAVGVRRARHCGRQRDGPGRGTRHRGHSGRRTGRRRVRGAGSGQGQAKPCRVRCRAARSGGRCSGRGRQRRIRKVVHSRRRVPRVRGQGSRGRRRRRARGPRRGRGRRRRRARRGVRCGPYAAPRDRRPRRDSRRVRRRRACGDRRPRRPRAGRGRRRACDDPVKLGHTPRAGPARVVRGVGYGARHAAAPAHGPA